MCYARIKSYFDNKVRVKKLEQLINILADLFPVDEPYVKDGVWSWAGLIDLAYPEINLIFLIHPKEIGVERMAPPPDAYTQKVYKIRDVSKETNACLIEINPHTPLNKDTLKEVLGKYYKL